MKHVQNRPYADPEKAARRITEHARAFEPIQDRRIYIEAINAPLLLGVALGEVARNAASPVPHFSLAIAAERTAPQRRGDVVFATDENSVIGTSIRLTWRE